VEARERIRDTLARYNWSGDAFRLQALAEAFCPDGVLEIRGRQPVAGRAAIAELLGGAATDDEARRLARRAAHRGTDGPEATRAPTIVRHNVTNIRFVALAPDQAQVECYFTVLTDIGLDHLGRYRDRFVPHDGDWLIAHRFVSTDWRAVDSLMARDQLPGLT
jgi:hypothetical protein